MLRFFFPNMRTRKFQGEKEGMSADVAFAMTILNWYDIMYSDPIPLYAPCESQ